MFPKGISSPRAERSPPGGAEVSGMGLWGQTESYTSQEVEKPAGQGGLAVCELWPGPAAGRWDEPTVRWCLGALMSTLGAVLARGGAAEPWPNTRAGFCRPWPLG